MGIWRCSGRLIGDGAKTKTGPWVVSTQMYEVDDVGTFTTTGTELADLNKPVERAVIGGTGDYARSEGIQQQRLIGFTDQEGVMLTVEVEIDPAG